METGPVAVTAVHYTSALHQQLIVIHVSSCKFVVSSVSFRFNDSIDVTLSSCPVLVRAARQGRGGPGLVTNGASGNIGGFSVGRHAKKAEREGMIYDPSLPPSTSAKVGRWGKFAAGKIGDGWTDGRTCGRHATSASCRGKEWGRCVQMSYGHIGGRRGEERRPPPLLSCMLLMLMKGSFFIARACRRHQGPEAICGPSIQTDIIERTLTAAWPRG